VNGKITSLPELPEGWAWTTLGAIALEPQYGWTTSAVETGSLRLLRTTDITTGKVDWNSVPFCKDEPPNVAKYLLHEGDIVISRAGSVGYSYLVRKPLEAVFASYLIRFRPLIDGSYFAMFLLSPSYWEAILVKSIGIALANVNASKLKQIPFPLPPPPEQHRIIAKIEELFTRLDAGVEALKKTKAQLKRYRQSVLKHAFEGKLTEEWRQAHKHELKSASILLERIKKECQKTVKAKYKELHPLDTSNLPELPEGWVWSNFEEVKKAEKNAIKAGPFGSSLKRESYVPHGYKIYGQEQVIRQDPFYGDYYVDEKKYLELKSCAVKPGDILISLVGTIGRVLILPGGSVEGIINPRLVKLSLEERLVDNKYIKAYVESSAVRDFFTLASHGETMEILNLGILRTLPVPVPSLAEQHRIVEEIERRFSVAAQIEKTVDHSLKQAERLRQSILKRAFEGKLVPQDPNGEPAEKLLERIKAERTKRLAEAKATSTSKKKTTTEQMGLV